LIINYQYFDDKTRYIIATQDPDLKEFARSIPGTPVLVSCISNEIKENIKFTYLYIDTYIKYLSLRMMQLFVSI
jgi:hypothetical protein